MMGALGISVPGPVTLHSARDSCIGDTRFGCNRNDSVENADAGATAAENPSRNLQIGVWAGMTAQTRILMLNGVQIPSEVICYITLKLSEKHLLLTLKQFGKSMISSL